MHTHTHTYTHTCTHTHAHTHTSTQAQQQQLFEQLDHSGALLLEAQQQKEAAAKAQAQQQQRLLEQVGASHTCQLAALERQMADVKAEHGTAVTARSAAEVGGILCRVSQIPHFPSV